VIHSMSTLARKTELGFILQNLDVNNLTDQQVKLIKESVLRYGLVVLPKQTITLEALEVFIKKVGDILKSSSLKSKTMYQNQITRLNNTERIKPNLK